MICIGIDPGLNGAMAVLDDDGEGYVLSCPWHWRALTTGKRRRVSDHKGILEHLHHARTRGLGWMFPDAVAFVEAVHGQSGDGGMQSFGFGFNCGIWTMGLHAAGIPAHAISPQKWKAAMGLIRKDKTSSVALAVELFPWAEPQLGPIRGNGSASARQGRAEALLIAEYGRRQAYA